MWTDTVYRVLAERIQALEAATEDRDTLRRDVDRLTLVARDRWDALKAMQAERDDARKALVAMTAERDALLTTVADWKQQVEEEQAGRWENWKLANEVAAERDALKQEVARLQAELLHKPGGMTVQPLRHWTDGVQTGRVYARNGKVEILVQDHVGGVAAVLSLPQALGVMAAIEACVDEAAEQGMDREN